MVLLSLFTLRGQSVQHWKESGVKHGYYATTGEGRNDQGLAVLSGTYLLQINVSSNDAPVKILRRKIFVLR